MILDVGCGVMPEHGSVSEAIGIDINFKHGKVYVKDPIIADAHNLPIRSDMSNVVYANAILEHLEYPVKCMKEIYRVMKDDGYGVITIPINADTRIEVFKRFFKEFPFATAYTVKKLLKWRKYYKIDGLMHKRLIELEDIERIFNIDREGIIVELRYHLWFSAYRPFKILRSLGIIKNSIYVREMGEYEFCIIKK